MHPRERDVRKERAGGLRKKRTKRGERRAVQFTSTIAHIGDRSFADHLHIICRSTMCTYEGRYNPDLYDLAHVSRVNTAYSA